MPASGAWRISYSLRSQVGTDQSNHCYLAINGHQLGETLHFTLSQSDQVLSTGGRVVTLEASAGDKIEMEITRMDGNYWDILYCAEFIPKM